MPESNSQLAKLFNFNIINCELSYKDNAWKQFTTNIRFFKSFPDCELSYKDNAWKQFTTISDVSCSLTKLWIIL